MCARQPLRTASRHFFRRIPRTVAPADAIRMSNPDRARRAAGPVVTGMIGVVGEGTAVGGRSCQNVMDIAVFGFAPDHLSLLVQDRQLPQTIVLLRSFQRIAMQFVLIGRNDGALGIVPRAGTDAVTRIDRRLTGARLRAEIGM